MATNLEHEKPETDVERTTKKIKLVTVNGETTSVDAVSSSEDVELSSDELNQNSDAITEKPVVKQIDDEDDNDDDDVSVDTAKDDEDEEATPPSTEAIPPPPAPVSSGFGGFTAFTGNGFGGFASFQSSESSGFSGFAQTASSSTTSSGFGVTASTSSDFLEIEKTAEKNKVETVNVSALTEAELANGEEDEAILNEKRTKLFKLVGQDYVEVGVGPFRVLKPKDANDDASSKASARMVMRRESYPNGPGTKLLLNARLSACVSSIKKSEKTLMIVIVEPATNEEEQKVKPATYLLRFSSPDDLVLMQNTIEALMPVARG